MCCALFERGEAVQRSDRDGMSAPHPGWGPFPKLLRPQLVLVSRLSSGWTSRLASELIGGSGFEVVPHGDCFPKRGWTKRVEKNVSSKASDSESSPMF